MIAFLTKLATERSWGKGNKSTTVLGVRKAVLTFTSLLFVMGTIGSNIGPALESLA